MDISSYNCNGHDEGEIKMDKQDILTGTTIETSDSGIGGRLEYWTTSRMVDANKNAQLDAACGSIIYGDTIDHMMLSKDGIHDDVRSWRDLTGASRTNSGAKPFHGILNGRLGQVRPCPTIEEKGYLVRKLKIGGDGEDVNGIAGRQGWEEAATSHDQDHHTQYDQKEEDRNLCQVDRSIEHRLQSSRDLGDCNVLEIDIPRSNCQDNGWISNERKDLGREKGIRDHVTYGECQKHQSADRGMTSVDGCGEFLSSGKDGKLAFTCAACGCHRNFHQHIVFSEEEEQELLKAKREKEEGSGNYFTSVCDIERVAHELMAAANRAIVVAQDSLCYSKGRAQDLSIEEQNIMAKISLENLDHITKVIVSTTNCLTLLQKPSTFRKFLNSCDKDNKSNCPHEDPSSSDASPVSTVEKRAISLLTPPSPCPFGVIGVPPLKTPILTFSDACGMHNCINVPRKPIEPGNHKLKRTRTRISLEQRAKLNAFAEKAGWTVVGQRKETIEAACQDIDFLDAWNWTEKIPICESCSGLHCNSACTAFH